MHDESREGAPLGRPRPRKLNIARETLRRLGSSVFARAAGGTMYEPDVGTTLPLSVITIIGCPTVFPEECITNATGCTGCPACDGTDYTCNTCDCTTTNA